MSREKMLAALRWGYYLHLTRPGAARLPWIEQVINDLIDQK